MSKYLFISSHSDDSELSCGGTMYKLASEGHTVNHLILSYCGNKQLTIEAQKAADILGVTLSMADFEVRKFDAAKIADYLYSLKDQDYVFAPSCLDRHDDHRTTAEQCRRIFNGNLITYLSPWNGAHSENYFVELTVDQLEKKINALYCYRSQSHRPYMSSDFIRAQAVYNGIKCGKKYAESFKIERLIQ